MSAMTSFPINVRSLNGKRKIIQVRPDSSVASIRAQLEENLPTAFHRIKLLCGSSEITTTTIAEAGLSEGSEVQAIVTLDVASALKVVKDYFAGLEGICIYEGTYADVQKRNQDHLVALDCLQPLEVSHEHCEILRSALIPKSPLQLVMFGDFNMRRSALMNHCHQWVLRDYHALGSTFGQCCSSPHEQALTLVSHAHALLERSEPAYEFDVGYFKCVPAMMAGIAAALKEIMLRDDTPLPRDIMFNFIGAWIRHPDFVNLSSSFADLIGQFGDETTVLVVSPLAHKSPEYCLALKAFLLDEEASALECAEKSSWALLKDRVFPSQLV